jgi:hypothetical protein
VLPRRILRRVLLQTGKLTRHAPSRSIAIPATFMDWVGWVETGQIAAQGSGNGHAGAELAETWGSAPSAESHDRLHWNCSCLFQGLHVYGE